MKKDFSYYNATDESKQLSIRKAFTILKVRQVEYKRVACQNLRRPNISVKNGLYFFAALVLILWVLLPCFLIIYIDSWRIRMLIALTVSVLVFVGNARMIIVWLIHAYQKLAPDELRLACVFEPSCSEYMLMAIEKYGVIHGIGKGISRLFRCHYPNGGVDNP
jgi:putative component of membrane protein insertase Oxa1/YidC/SpoIIIJ protein YidD